MCSGESTTKNLFYRRSLIMTKKEMYKVIAAAINPAALPDGVTAEDVTNFCERQIDLLNNKKGSARKPTANQIQNEGFKTQILDILKANDRPMRIKEICEEIPELEDVSNQRINHMLIQLRRNGKVERIYEKKVAYFIAI